MDCQVYKTVLHPKMKEFPDKIITVFVLFCTTCREEICSKATVNVKFKNIYQVRNTKPRTVMMWILQKCFKGAPIQQHSPYSSSHIENNRWLFSEGDWARDQTESHHFKNAAAKACFSDCQASNLVILSYLALVLSSLYTSPTLPNHR